MDSFGMNGLKRMRVFPKEVHLWSFSCDLGRPTEKEHIQWLTGEEMNRAFGFRFEKDKKVFVTARFLLRNLLGGYLDTDLKGIDFSYGDYGRPKYPNHLDLDFNISHSDNQILLAFSRALPVGVDLEKIKGDFDVLNLAGTFFAKAEIKALSQLHGTEKYRGFYRCWTRKEAFIKAIGKGLSYPLASFAVSLDRDDHAQLIALEGPEQRANWHLHSFIPATGFIAALATKGVPEKISLFEGDSGFF